MAMIPPELHKQYLQHIFTVKPLLAAIRRVNYQAAAWAQYQMRERTK